MSADPLPGAVLAGYGVRLVPLDRDSADPALWGALHATLARPEVFAGGWGGGAAALTAQRAADPAAFAEWFRKMIPAGGLTYLVTRDGAAAGGAGAGGAAPREPTLLGTTSYGFVDLTHESLHIGWTAYTPDAWGTSVNPACKLLLLEHAFGLGFGRVQIQADARNDRSRAAIARLGATFEGELRRTNPRADGSWRDTAVYSILTDEWPQVEAGLRARLAAPSSRG